ncbi:GNAT family N-acetyltransferase [Acidovorax sp. SDU_ACID1]|uniref:GNAT family N-acetyltransferase n=1 Tax=Acidovorax sp. SDU_ACID1 TaxID=3136632 RepID=UPI0038731E50
MSSEPLTIALLLKRQDVLPLVEQVVLAAESDRPALGWYARKVYQEAAIAERLIVAVAGKDGDVRYAGHLLFATTFPRGYVMQIHVDAAHRRHGVAQRMLDALKAQLSALNYIAISARVAEDLRQSQEFWESQGFYAHGTAPGGKTRGRTLVLRSHELPTQQLFAASGLTHRDPLGLAADPCTATKLYLLDLNVIFDLGPRRARHQDVVDLFALERLGVCRLALSTEFDAELKRSATSAKTDPMQGLGQVFPKFSVPPDDVMARLTHEIAPAIFPERFAADALTANDHSDLRHLGTVIHHNLAGLVTSDGDIRDAAALLRQRYGIEVLSPSAFKILGELDTGIGAVTASTRDTLSLVPLALGREAQVRALLSSLSVSLADQTTVWAADDGSSRARHRCVVLESDRVIGYLMWPSNLRGGTWEASLAVDEHVSCAPDAARLMIVHLMGCAREEVQRMRLNLAPAQACVREVALEMGFTGTPETQALHKVSLHAALLPHNWSALRTRLQAVSDITLPTAMPVFRQADQYIELMRPDGQRTQVTAFALETLLSPALLCLPGRPAVLVPIQRDYAEHLLDHLEQMQLLPRAKALLYQQRHYLSAPQSLKVFARGHLMFFYESTRGHGQKAVVAMARVVNAYLSAEGAIDKADLDRSVLEAADLAAIGKSEIKTVVVFDNVKTLPRPVPLESLKRLGCGKATQLLTSRLLTPEQTHSIILEGFPP